MRALSTLVLLLLVAPGCHAKFKKEAPTLGAVRPQVLNGGRPFVQLGYTSGDGLVSAVINTVQAVKSINETDRIANAVQIDQVNSAMVQGISDTLGSGPPFAFTSAETAPVLQIEVQSYGMYVPYLGAPGSFTFDLVTRIYKPDGDRVYTAHTTCEIGAGNPDAAAVVLGVVNNSAQLKSMTDEEINNTFVTIGSWCGQEIVRKMRKHAG